MRIERRYTKDAQPSQDAAYAGLPFRLTTSEIKNPDGSIVFKLDNVEVPEFWSQVASDVLAQKYFRKAGVPARLKKVEEEHRPLVPVALGRRRGSARSAAGEGALYRRTLLQAGVRSARRHLDLLGLEGRLFRYAKPTRRRSSTSCASCSPTQMCAPNSPQWFNTGLHWAYGIDGPSQGHFYVDFQTGKLTKSKSSYEHPQPHACFIQSIADDLVNEGGIMDLWVREARLFKYGSGTGSNFSNLRGEGERLSGGGKSSGLMSFLKIGDRAAGAIKSGGTTRRARQDGDRRRRSSRTSRSSSTGRCSEEQKVAALVTGSKINQKHLKAVMKACVNCEGSGDDCFDPEKNPALKPRDQARAPAPACRTT